MNVDDKNPMSEDDNKEDVVKDTKLSEYSKYDEDEERRKVRADYRELSKAIEGKTQNCC